MNFIVKNSGNLNIIFLHGWGCDHTSFLFLQQYLTKSTLHFANLDGFGGQEPPTEPSIKGYAQRLKEYIIQNNLKNVVLVGHSFGGRVAIEYASSNNCLGVVLVNSAGIKPRFSLKKQLKICKYKVTKYFVNKGLISKQRLNKFGSPDYKNSNKMLQAVLVSCVNYNQKPLLKQINQPTLIVWGNKDNQTPLYMAKQLNKHIKNSTLFVLDNCGHFSFLQKPYQFYQYLNQFICNLQKGENYE